MARGGSPDVLPSARTSSGTTSSDDGATRPSRAGRCRGDGPERDRLSRRCATRFVRWNAQPSSCADRTTNPPGSCAKPASLTVTRLPRPACSMSKPNVAARQARPPAATRIRACSVGLHPSPDRRRTALGRPQSTSRALRRDLRPQGEFRPPAVATVGECEPDRCDGGL